MLWEMQEKLLTELSIMASGIVDIMGAAKAMASSGIKLKRSVMFLFLGGEESGLSGASSILKNLFFRKKKLLLILISIWLETVPDFAVSAGSPYKELLDYFVQANTQYIHRTMHTSAPVPGAYYGRPRSDGVVFSMAGLQDNGYRNYGRL